MAQNATELWPLQGEVADHPFEQGLSKADKRYPLGLSRRWPGAEYTGEEADDKAPACEPLWAICLNCTQIWKINQIGKSRYTQQIWAYLNKVLNQI